MSSRVIHCVWLALALLVSGCLHYQPRPLSVDASAQALAERKLAARSWTLEALVVEAQARHPEIALAKAQYETARAAVITAGEKPNPTISVGPQLVTPFRLDAGSYALDFDWPIETAGKRGYRQAQAQSLARAAALEVAGASWKVRAAVRKALLDLYAGQQKKLLLETAIAQQEDIVKAMDQRVAAGELSRTEVMQSRLLLTQLRLQAADAGKAFTLGHAALAEAMGMSVSGVEPAKLVLNSFATMPAVRSAAALRKKALTKRADVLAALADYAAAEAALRLEIAKQYPDVHLNPGYQFDAGVNKWAVGFSITPPLLNQNRGPIAEAEAKRAEAKAKFEVVQAKALAEVEHAEAGLSAARSKLALTDKMLAELAQQRDAAQALVKSGSTDRLASVTAQLEYDTARIAQLDAQIEVQQAVGEWEAAAQTVLSR